MKTFFNKIAIHYTSLGKISKTESINEVIVNSDLTDENIVALNSFDGIITLNLNYYHDSFLKINKDCKLLINYVDSYITEFDDSEILNKFNKIYYASPDEFLINLRNIFPNKYVNEKMVLDIDNTNYNIVFKGFKIGKLILHDFPYLQKNTNRDWSCFNEVQILSDFLQIHDIKERLNQYVDLNKTKFFLNNERIMDDGYVKLSIGDYGEYGETFKDVKRFYDIFSLNKQCNESDIFKTDDGKIKQIQNLHKFKKFEKLAKRIMMDVNLNGKILNMQYFIKHPNYKMTAPHQDGAYFDDVNRNIYTIWIPLQDVDEDNSTMFYKDWDGKREIIKHDNCGSNIRTRSGKTGRSQYIPEDDLSEYKPVNLKVGELVVHNQFCQHYSSVNKSDKERVALTIIVELND